MHRVLLALALLLCAAPASTQTLSVTVPPATPFKIEWQHDGLEMPSFRWWCDGAIVKNFSQSEAVATPNADGVNFTYTATVPGLPVGTHQCFISAYNGVTINGISEVKSAAIPVVVGEPKLPSTPFNVRIVVTIRSGG